MMAVSPRRMIALPKPLFEAAVPCRDRTGRRELGFQLPSTRRIAIEHVNRAVARVRTEIADHDARARGGDRVAERCAAGCVAARERGLRGPGAPRPPCVAEDKHRAIATREDHRTKSADAGRDVGTPTAEHDRRAELVARVTFRSREAPALAPPTRSVLGEDIND